MINFDLTGKVVILTGATGGIGGGFAKALAEQNANVVLLGRRVNRLEELVEELSGLGTGELVPMSCDLGSEDSINAVIAATLEKFGKIDVLVNNAGAAMMEGTLEHTTEHWDEIHQVDLRGTFIFCREAAKAMKETGGGSIINISSMVCCFATPDQVSYAAMKAAVTNMSKAMALDLGQFNIRVNVIAPGLYPGTGIVGGPLDPKSYPIYRRTKIPFGRTGVRGDMDAILLYFASDASSYTTGQAICVDGGLAVTRW